VAEALVHRSHNSGSKSPGRQIFFAVEFSSSMGDGRPFIRVGRSRGETGQHFEVIDD
jgi:hypothetical protein